MKNVLNIEGKFAKYFVIFGVIIQLLTFFITKDAVLSLVSGIAGVISVVQCAQRKLSFYFWGLLQIVTFMFIAAENNLYGKLIENAYYFITMIIGIFIWSTNSIDYKVIPKTLSKNAWYWIIIGIMVAFVVLYIILINTNCTVLFFDAMSTSYGIFAQILMMLGYKEQWILWLALDIFCIILFAIVGEWCMVAQYIFWTINCIYGIINWKNYGTETY